MRFIFTESQVKYSLAYMDLKGFIFIFTFPILILLCINNFLLYFLTFSCLFLLHIFMNLEFRIMFCEKEDDYAPAARELW